jgi:hypothetical protein
LLRKSFAEYFRLLILQLQYPEVVRRDRETWPDICPDWKTSHFGCRTGASLSCGFPESKRGGLWCSTASGAGDHVGFRWDIKAAWSFPQPTHSKRRFGGREMANRVLLGRASDSPITRPPVPTDVQQRLGEWRRFPCLRAGVRCAYALNDFAYPRSPEAADCQP